MALKPSKIMAWDFTRQIAFRNHRRNSYAKWRAHEEAAEAKREEYRAERKKAA